MVADEFVGADQGFKARHLGLKDRECQGRKIDTVSNRWSGKTRRQRNTCKGGDLLVRPCDITSQILVDVTLVDQQEIIPLLIVHMPLLMTFSRLPQQFRRFGRTGAFNLVLQGEEGPSLIAETLNPAAQGLNRLTELGVALCLGFGAFDDEFGEVFVVAFDQAGFLSDLSGEGCDRTLLSSSVAMRSEMSAMASASRARAC